MSDKTNLKISKLYSISDLKGYLYKKRSYDNLWRYHDMEHLHDHKGTCEPEVIQVKNTEDDIERYPEITYSILDLKPDKPGKHDKFAPVSRVHGLAPDLGLEVIELSDYYSVGSGENKLTSGVFIYKVDLSSVSYSVGLRVGDVITEIKRPQLEKKPSSWKRCHLDYDEDDLNMLTVTEAINIINKGNVPSVDFIVKGIIYEITEMSVDSDVEDAHGMATYIIKDNLLDKQYITVSKGKWLNQNKFTTGKELEIGGVIVVNGKLKNNNGIFEIDEDNYVIRYTSPDGKVFDSVELHSIYRSYQISTIKDMMTLLDRMDNNERVILTVWRDGIPMEVEMRIPFVNKVYTEFDTPKITIKRIPYMCIEDKDWNMYTCEDDEWLAKAYRRLTCDIESGNLVVNMPDTLTDVRFYIDDEGNLKIDYD